MYKSLVKRPNHVIVHIAEEQRVAMEVSVAAVTYCFIFLLPVDVFAQLLQYASIPEETSGRYVPDDEGRYIPDDSGRYIPDYSGLYIHDPSGNYKSDGTGGYDQEKFRVVDNFIRPDVGLKTRPPPPPPPPPTTTTTTTRPTTTSTLPPVIYEPHVQGGWKIIRQVTDVGLDGYHWEYETENGITAEERGALANKGTEAETMRAKGFFQYTGPDNIIYEINYTADENGFLPEGNHLPTPPPLPEALVKAIELHRSLGNSV